MPKNTESIRPMAVSCLILEYLIMISIKYTDMAPVIKAPIKRTSGSLVPDSIKDKQIPGKTECAIASPISALFLKSVKHTMIAEVAVSNTLPITTYRTLGLVNEKNSNKSIVVIVWNYDL